MQVPIKDIKISPRIRSRKVDVEDLMESFSIYGQLQPVLLNQDMELIAGFRRYKAAKKLGWESIEAKIVDVRDKKKRILIELEENQNRKNFNAEEIEKAKKLLARYDKQGFFSQLWYETVEFFQKWLNFWR